MLRSCSAVIRSFVCAEEGWYFVIESIKFANAFSSRSNLASICLSILLVFSSAAGIKLEVVARLNRWWARCRAGLRRRPTVHVWLVKVSGSLLQPQAPIESGISRGEITHHNIALIQAFANFIQDQLSHPHHALVVTEPRWFHLYVLLTLLVSFSPYLRYIRVRRRAQ